ncbi:alpha-L-rhamnosidase-related protein [Sediminicola sp. 1XM1-17]|uniref:alpha-L-rhamnosidase-related protein n=1 Tax=Sediminicola sp. 1XM1-17 TaxID=3127702 RepID=UPI00307710C5
MGNRRAFKKLKLRSWPACLVLALTLICCKTENVGLNFEKALNSTPHIEGKKEYLNSPFVTAGNRVYMVGHQDGTFPEIGWHIKGEMGGIWDHPIKLMDGFDAELLWEEEQYALDSAHTFVNYPFANRHVFSIPNKQLSVQRWQFVPDNKEGVVIQYVLKNTSNRPVELKFKYTGYSDLRPTWLGERTAMVDGEDKARYDNSLGIWMVKDSLNPWYVAFGADRSPMGHQWTKNRYAGKGSASNLTYPVRIAANGEWAITFTIAGSYQSKEAVVHNFKDIQGNSIEDLVQKEQRYQQLANNSKLTVPDKKLQETFQWLKYNADWMVRTVPEIGTGIAAGIPDYPWWFGVDSEYALKGYMAVGQTDVVEKTIKLLDSMSNVVNGNGRIIHEMSTNGAVFNKGNINETPQFASMIWETYRWNGDLNFLKAYFPTIKKGLQWLMEENDGNKNLFPDGFGMMEIHGMDSEMIDVAAYTQRAFSDASKIALELGDQTLAKSYSDTATLLKEKINAEFWSETFGSYADFIGTDQQALRLIDDAIVRADTLNKPWAVEELQRTKKSIVQNPSETPRPFVLHHNWVVNTPMEMQIADEHRADKALETAEKYVNPFGVFVTGIDRDDSAGTDEGSFKGSTVFSYTGAVMTLPTGVQAVAENNYGNPDKALNYLKRMSRSFSYALPGSMYEVSPDYGMIAQAWNIYGFAIPIVQQFFGIQPNAAERRVTIAIQMPEEWDKASLEDVVIADNKLSIFYEKSKSDISLKVVQQNTDWTIDIVFPMNKDNVKHRIISSPTDVKSSSDAYIITTKQASTDILVAIIKSQQQE